MRMIRDLGDPYIGDRGNVVAIGNFDGVHLGHKAILERLCAESSRLGLRSCVITFFPHPLKVLDPTRAPSMIQSLEDRIFELEKAGIDILVVVPFTLEFAAMSARDFVERHLAASLHCRALFVGRDARFGRDREGDVDMLRGYASGGLFRLEVVPAVHVEGTRVSSSGIRRMIEAGDVEQAGVFIGRTFSISGEVVKGDGRGRTLGFPTANVLADGETRPKNGVYAGVVELQDGTRWPAAVHLGPIPTFNQGRPVLEAHLLGYSGELRGTRVRVYFKKFLREILKFHDVEDLKATIARDCTDALTIAGTLDV